MGAPLLAKVVIGRGGAPGGEDGVIRGIESGTLVRSACVGYALSFKRVENRADGNAGLPYPGRSLVTFDRSKVTYMSRPSSRLAKKSLLVRLA